MKKLNFKALSADLLSVAGRFYLVLFFVFTLAVLSFMEINDKNFELEFNYWGGIILSTIVAVSIVLFNEINTHKLRRLFSYLAIVAVAVYGFYFFNHKITWESMQFAAFMVTAVLVTFVVLFFGKNTDAAFWTFAEKNVRELITTMIYISVLFGGLTLAVYAVDVLFEVKVTDKVYANLSVICYLIVAPVYFLMNVPQKSEFYADAPDYGKFLKILGLYVFLPVLAIYLVILYFYLFKIILRWELPNGWVTTLVSVLALGGYIAKFLLYPVSDNKVVRFLNRWFSLLLLPLIVLMSVGLARRIADYGISINRLYVLVFNVWLYGVSIYLFVTKSAHLRWLVVSFAAVLLVVSVGPWSVFAVTKRVVEKDLKTLLTENKLLVNGQLVDNKSSKIEMGDSIEAEISDKVYYYVSNFGIENWKRTFNDNRKLTGAYQITESLGVDNYVINEKKRTVFASHTSKEVYDIKGYNRLITNLEVKQDSSQIFSDKDYKIEFVDNKIQITDFAKKKNIAFSIQPVISKIYTDSDNETLKNQLLIQKNDNCILLIHSISAECKSSTNFKIQQISFSLYLK